MNLVDLVGRARPPTPWAEGDNIPWHDPAFSQRMLAEHLSQGHDAASRRFATIDRHVGWIHDTVLGGRCTRVLDLGCGPGLYAIRLARLGHACVGIDYSPASIAYARREAEAANVDCTYRLADIRNGGYGTGYGLALLIFGELNVFPREHAMRILAGVRRALEPGGVLVLEPHTFAAVRRLGERPPDWYTASGALFGDAPHAVLREHFWDGPAEVATIRTYVVDAASGAVARYAQSMQAYREDEYVALLRSAGFDDIVVHPSLTGDEAGEAAEYCAIVARVSPDGSAPLVA